MAWGTPVLVGFAAAALGVLGTAPAAMAAEVDVQDAPAGAVEVVASAAAEMKAAFPGQAGCFGDPAIQFELLPGRRGEYRGGGIVVVNPDRPIAGMATTVAHELGHHLMFACGVYGDDSFRARFYAAQGLPLSRPWIDHSHSWSGSPAEHFAEAVALYARGTNLGRISISPATLDLVEELAVDNTVESGIFVAFERTVPSTRTGILPPRLDVPTFGVGSLRTRSGRPVMRGLLVNLGRR